ncbi:MAG: hypothetical protein V1804_03880 [Patescibacteria group bacterium]
MNTKKVMSTVLLVILGILLVGIVVLQFTIPNWKEKATAEEKTQATQLANTLKQLSRGDLIKLHPKRLFMMVDFVDEEYIFLVGHSDPRYNIELLSRQKDLTIIRKGDKEYAYHIQFVHIP